jgi:cytochrome c oxidase assembly protein subunit 15
MFTPRPRALANWLFIVALLVFLMVIVGGITRLTESGLSITEWKPVTGAIPPLSPADWQAAFDAYKHSSQYVLMNQGMDLAAFKHIYFWEYFHRLLGRIMGAVYAVPLIWFLARRAVPYGYTVKLVLLLLLGGAQGGIGWLMVQSGLTNRVNVAPAMLAAHLTMALFLLSALVWTALDLRQLARNVRTRPARLRPFAALVLMLLFVQIFFGAITAGLRAGHVSNTWPLMNDHFVPDGISWAGSYWMTLTSDPYLIHFLHRWWAWVVVAALILLSREVKRAGGRGVSIAIHSAFGTQILLGIATVMTGVSLPLAVLHQAVGVLLLIATICGCHLISRRTA